MQFNGKLFAPLIIDIEGNSRNDGPGIRSVVFLKGCPLSCIWCQNPESKRVEPELWWDRDKCVGCDECIRVCPKGVISRDNPFFIKRSLCDLCFSCAKACPSRALKRVGQKMSVEEIVKKVVDYKPFFDSSGGGVTLSGGEATLGMQFTSVLFKKFKEVGIHTLLETAGLFDFNNFISSILPYTDMIYFDLKLMNSLKHKCYCGVSNESIIENFVLLNKLSKSESFELIPRTPLIPGITDSKENIEALGVFYKKHKIKRTILLTGNPAWEYKLDRIGMNSIFDRENPIWSFYNEDKLLSIKKQF